MDTMILQPLLLMLIYLSSSGLSCGPVSFNSTSFTIRGPCPNNTVLAAVGSTVQYRCDYEDNNIGPDLPYWHIPGLIGTPFIEGEGADHGITIASAIAASGHTTVSIPVKEQYLNNTLNIQCGLCSLLVCFNEDRLSDNITSTSVKLVTFGSPYNLHDSIQSSPSWITLSWSPPPVSIEYSNVSSYFTYDVKLTNQLNSSQTISFNTSTTAANISAGDIPDGHDVCGDYSWSVTPIANGGITNRGDTIYSNNSISIPSVPLIKNGSFVANLSQCETSQLLSITFEVSSCSEAGLKSTVLVTVADTVYNTTTRITPVGPNSYAVRSDIPIAESQLDFKNNVLVDVQVENNYGHFEANYEIKDDINTVTCISIPVVPVPSTSSLAYFTIMSTSEVRVTSDTSKHLYSGTTTTSTVIDRRLTYALPDNQMVTLETMLSSPAPPNTFDLVPIAVTAAIANCILILVIIVTIIVIAITVYKRGRKESSVNEEHIDVSVNEAYKVVVPRSTVHTTTSSNDPSSTATPTTLMMTMNDNQCYATTTNTGGYEKITFN